MRRSLALGFAWLLAAAVAVVVAWQGVGLVGDQVTDRRPATLTDAEIEAALEATPPTTAPGTTATTPPADQGGAGEDAAIETFRVTGGAAALRFSPGGVTVVWATPDHGYEVESEPGDGNGWRIEFEGEAGRSRIDAWWDGGPRSRVRDAADESHDDDRHD
ncbi:MAG TPA: hypothetical protein VFZ77_15325 [Acidimicrobiales bacterium]